MMKSAPILLWGKRLMEQERFSQADLDAVDKEVLARMEETVAFVEASPDPPPESMYEDVYVRSPYINMKAAEKDPAWRAAIKDDRMPPALPSPTAAAAPEARPAPGAEPKPTAASPAAPNPAEAAVQATA